MNRRRSQSPTGSTSLFPFLAVLICTMGALIVLLVVVVHQSRAQAGNVTSQNTSSEGAAAETTEEKLGISLQEQLQDARWQADELRASRERTLQRMQEQQRLLSMTEDQIRRLQDELNRLEREAQALETLRAARDLQTDSTQQVLDRLQSQIDQARQALEAARTRALSQRRGYALIPYQGPQGTQRRPIYVECLGDRVVIQPEGIVLVSSDFEDPLGPDNPLAAALRATREHWLNTRVLDNTSQAYPLLIVRPAGAHSYAACRAALRGWDDEFGYELIPDSMVLSYPPPDPSLADVLRRSVRDARLRNNRPDPETAVGSRSSGGSIFDAPDAGSMNSSGGSPSGGMGAPDQASSSESSGASGGSRVDTGDSATLASPSTDSSGVLTPTANSNLILPHTAESSPPLELGPKREDADRSTTTRGTDPDATRQNGSSEAGSPRRSHGAGSPQAVGGPGGPNSIGSLADDRGENWALPNAAKGSIGMSRPVLVLCQPGKLTLLADSAAKLPAQAFEFRNSPAEAIPAFVEALWQRIEAWGVAGPGAHWKPVLKMQVEDGSEAVFEQLSRLLDRSGLTVERR